MKLRGLSRIKFSHLRTSVHTGYVAEAGSIRTPGALRHFRFQAGCTRPTMRCFHGATYGDRTRDYLRDRQVSWTTRLTPLVGPAQRYHETRPWRKTEESNFYGCDPDCFRNSCITILPVFLGEPERDRTSDHDVKSIVRYRCATGPWYSR